MVYLIFLLYVAASALGMVLIKYGGRFSGFQLGNHTVSLQVHSLFVIGILLYVLSFILWIYILQKFQLSFISPVAYGLTFISIAILSIIVFKESMTILQIVGIVLIISGVFLASIGKK